MKTQIVSWRGTKLFRVTETGILIENGVTPEDLAAVIVEQNAYWLSDRRRPDYEAMAESSLRRHMPGLGG